MFVAVNFQSVCYIMYKIGHTLELAPNFLSEEERHESEEGADDEFKKKESEFLHFHSDVFYASLPVPSLRPDMDVKFVSANYSGKIYTPPELRLI